MSTPSVTILFFNAPAPTEIYTLSLHDALPILTSSPSSTPARAPAASAAALGVRPPAARAQQSSTRSAPAAAAVRAPRSEEHTSELQSQSNLVCRLLLEKKK